MPDNRYESKPYLDDGKTREERTEQIESILITLSPGSESPAQRVGIENLLSRMDPTLATRTGKLMQDTIAQSPGMSKEQEGRLKDNILYNAFQELKRQNEQQLSK